MSILYNRVIGIVQCSLSVISILGNIYIFGIDHSRSCPLGNGFRGIAGRTRTSVDKAEIPCDTQNGHTSLLFSSLNPRLALRVWSIYPPLPSAIH